ncbi:MAG: ABC transporter ATP-binding protein [Thermoplasmata archaeon]
MAARASNLAEEVALPDDSVLPDSEAVPSPEGAASPDHSDAVLTIRDLKTYFYTYDGVVKALDGVTLQIRKGQTTGLVGETGCGKSVTAFSVTRLIPDPPGRVISGEIRFEGANLLWGLDKEASFKPIAGTNRVKIRRSFRRIKQATDRMSSVRGRGIAMIFQEPTQAMNPIFTIANQIGETLLLHRGVDIVDGILEMHPDAPEVAPALDNLVATASRAKTGELRVAADELGKAVGLESVGTQAYALFRAASRDVEGARADIEDVLRHLRPDGLQRAFLRHRRRMTLLQDELNEVYLLEMREGKAHGSERRRLRRKLATERWRNIYFGLWGIRSRSKKALERETFWRSVRMLEGMSIANPVQVARGFPFELSGGMLQRVMIAMALSAEPKILLADEPTTALDVTIQAQILELMRDLKTRAGTAILLITHDLAVIAEVADRVCVMYAGTIVEEGEVHEIFRRPLHPYTQGLLASIPRLDRPDQEFTSIPGSVPNLIYPPSGCRFHPRCPYAMPVCKGERPPVTLEGEDHAVACYLYKGPVRAD